LGRLQLSADAPKAVVALWTKVSTAKPISPTQLDPAGASGATTAAAGNGRAGDATDEDEEEADKCSMKYGMRRGPTLNAAP